MKDKDLYTLEHAKELICPFTPVIDAGGTQSITCVGNHCMMWKWDYRGKELTKGKCGLCK